MNIPIVVQFGSRSILIGRAGDAEPLDAKLIPIGAAEDEEFLWRLFYKCYHDELMVAPSSTKVVIIENVLLPLNCKELLCQVLLKRLLVSSIVFVPDVLMTCFSSGVKDGLVIDVGWEYVAVVPILDLRILDNWSHISNKAGKFLYDNLKEILPPGTDLDILVPQIMACEGDKDFQYREISITKEVRNGFLKKTIGHFDEDPLEYDDDELPISQVVLKTLKDLPVDVKKRVFPHLMITGLASNIPGFKMKLLKEVKVKFPRAEGITTLGPWCGGSLYTVHALMKGATDAMELSQDEFNGIDSIPDWQSLKFQ